MKTIFYILISFLILLTANFTHAATATQSGQTIREQVKEKIEEAKNSPKAYAGAVTDKNQNSLQLKTPKGEIKLASIDASSTTFVKVGSKTTSAKFDEVAIGDFIVAMGYRNGNDILNARRVLITPAFTAPKRKIIRATVKTVTAAKKMVVVETNNESYTLKFPKRWQGPEIKELSEGDNIVIIGEIEGSSINLRSIFKL